MIMSPANETILSKQIKGLTWGVVFTMVSTFGGGVYIAFKGYMNIIEEVRSGKQDAAVLRNEVNMLRVDVSRHEAMLYNLMMSNKNTAK